MKMEIRKLRILSSIELQNTVQEHLLKDISCVYKADHDFKELIDV